MVCLLKLFYAQCGLVQCMGKVDTSFDGTSESWTCSISERIQFPTSNKICPLIPYLKHCGDLVWCMLGRTLTLCKRTVTRRPWLRH